MKKRLAQIVLALCVILPLLAMNVWAEDLTPTDPVPANPVIIAFGNCGAETDGLNLSWELKSNGVLTIKGTGKMEQMYNTTSDGSTAPWSQHRDKISAVEIGEGVENIENYAFKGLTEMTEVVIPSTVTSIGTSAFYNCINLQEIKIPTGVKNIESHAFENCKNLEILHLYPGLETIHADAFAYCYGIKNVHFWGSRADYDPIKYVDKNNHVITLGTLQTRNELDKVFTSTPIVHWIGTYVITFDPQGGVMTSTSATTDVFDCLSVDALTAHKPTTTKDPCYTFDGWYLNAAGVGTKIDETYEFKQDTTLYAKWIEHEELHQEQDISPVVPTCGEPGSKDGTECAICGKILKEPVVDPATGEHTKGDPVDDLVPVTVEATCTEKGSVTTIYKCAVCDNEYPVVEETDELGHEIKTLEAVPATCTEPGLTEGKICQREGCGYVEVAQEEIDPLGHDWNVAPTEKEIVATCTEAGGTLFTYECKNGCGTTWIKREESTPALGHKMEKADAVAATCTKTGLTEGEKCANCDETTQEVVPALGHAWVKTDDGTEEITKNPTCTEAGSMTIKGGAKCSRCDATTTDEETVELDPLSEDKTHTWDDGEVTTKPTETEKGVMTYTCTVCGETKTEEVPATGIPSDPENPDDPDDPSKPTDPENPDDPNTPDNPDDPNTPDNPDNPNTPEKPDDPSKPTEPETPTTPTTPSEPDSPRYRIYTPTRVTGGSYTVNYSSATEGTRVTIRINPRSNYYLDWLSVTNLTTGRELTLTERDWDEFTFIMPASSVELDISYRSGSSGGTGGGYIAVPPEAKPGPTAWYYANQHIYHVTTGLVSDGTPITRDMLISVLYNLSDHSAETGTSVGAEANNALLWAVRNSIVPDFTASGLSGLDKAITREQAAMLLFRGAGYNGYSVYQRAGISYFADYSQVRPIAQDAMSWAMATGLLTSTSPSTLSPRETVSCGQMGDIIYRLTRMQ